MTIVTIFFAIRITPLFLFSIGILAIFSIALIFKIFHPNLKWSSKTLKLQELLLKKTSSLKTLPVSSFCELTFYNTSSPK